MPMPLPVLPMSIDEYHVMPHRLGWKHEYYDGAARLQPSMSAYTEYEWPAGGASEQLDPVAGVAVRDARADDEAALIALYEAAFEDGPDHAGYPADAYRTEAGKAADISRARIHVAESGSALLGAIRLRDRFVDGTSSATIEPVMVRPEARRQGIASALLRRAIESSTALGIQRITSGAHLANAPSVAWHERLGFVERRGWSSVAARLGHWRWMAGHHEHAGDAEAARLAHEEADRLQAEFERLAPANAMCGGMR